MVHRGQSDTGPFLTRGQVPLAHLKEGRGNGHQTFAMDSNHRRRHGETVRPGDLLSGGEIPQAGSGAVEDGQVSAVRQKNGGPRPSPYQPSLQLANPLPRADVPLVDGPVPSGKQGLPVWGEGDDGHIAALWFVDQPVDLLAGNHIPNMN